VTESTDFYWGRYPEAEDYVEGLIAELAQSMSKTSLFMGTLYEQTGSRLVDWVDHLILADGDTPRGQLIELGFEPEEVAAEQGDTVYHHPGAVFPRILLREETGAPQGSPLALALQVEEIRHILMNLQIPAGIEGTPQSPYRRAVLWQENERQCLVVERRGHPGFVPMEMPTDFPHAYLQALELWATRPRQAEDERKGMENALDLARFLVSSLGTDTAAWLAFEAERRYWQDRNRAAQVQKADQDSLGLGWANHDHHTFRSSRANFPLLIQILETFGFRPRERFYAGREAGWGAQVMEQPICRLAVFADVDLSPEEVEGDFAHTPLPERQELGTVGLWCALHGDSMLSAGLHHLAGRFDFNAATAKLADRDIKMMRPFSDFPYLRQAFTRGESWQVEPQRLERLVDAGLLSNSQQAEFTESGAIGSHLENIQRAEGFKGFNQAKISDIIRRTDPRTQDRGA
jgi:hypothetical protein